MKDGIGDKLTELAQRMRPEDRAREKPRLQGKNPQAPKTSAGFQAPPGLQRPDLSGPTARTTVDPAQPIGQVKPVPRQVSLEPSADRQNKQPVKAQQPETRDRAGKSAPGLAERFVIGLSDAAGRAAKWRPSLGGSYAARPAKQPAKPGTQATRANDPAQTVSLQPKSDGSVLGSLMREGVAGPQSIRPPSSMPSTVPSSVAPPLIEPSPALDEWLIAEGLRKSFGRREVVRGVSLGVRRGEVVGLLGPNGAGKTTTFYMIMGLIAADRGAIELDGYDITKLPMYRRARLGVGYLPQEPSIFRGMTVEQNIGAVLELIEPNRRKRREKLDSLLEEFHITRLRKSPAIALSGGERRRVEIARALASQPTFMLLDEPFAGIDPIAVNDIRLLVRHLTGRGIGVLITDHNVRETLGLIDRAYIIHDGQVLMEGTPQAVVANEQVRQHYLGEDFTL